MKSLRIAFWLFLVGAAIYTGWLVVPVFIANYRLEESIDDSARSAAVNGQRTEDEIRSLIFQDARDLQIPLKPEDIKVERDGGEVVISADYTVHIDLPVRPIDLQFHPSSKRGTFTFR